MGLFSAIGSAISRPVRGLGRIARGKFRQGLGDIGAGVKTAAPLLAATTGIGAPLAIGLGVGGGAAKSFGEGGDFGDVLKGAAGGGLAAGAAGIGRRLSGGANALRGGTAGIDAPIAGFGGLGAEGAREVAGGIGSGIGGRLAGIGRGVASFARENPVVASNLAGTAANVYGAREEGRAMDEELAFRREQIERANRRQENADPILQDILRRLLTVAPA